MCVHACAHTYVTTYMDVFLSPRPLFSLVPSFCPLSPSPSLPLLSLSPILPPASSLPLHAVTLGGSFDKRVYVIAQIAASAYICRRV